MSFTTFYFLIIALLLSIARTFLKGIFNLNKELRIKTKEPFEENDPYCDKTGKTTKITYYSLITLRLVIGVTSIIVALYLSVKFINE
ncbi:hypothetical protein KKI84_000004 [Providencia rettgeri]|nr:hypothetical protein [Providencia rettgeri]ELR5073916.1 hypothetical protein [Providencia stuartii]